MALLNFPSGSILSVILLIVTTLETFPVRTMAKALGNETDRLALLKLKESVILPGDPYGVFSSWNESNHFCEWFGVECSKKHQRITALKLRGYNLRGTISPFIGNLSFLRSIDLANNSLSGEIPPQVGHLFRLKQLILKHNILEGKIPLHLASCSKLERLDLSSNRLVGTIPSGLGSLEKLTLFNLGLNKLTGRIPASLGNFSSSLLQYFNLGDNHLVGSVPEELGQLKGLIGFSIGLNNLNGTIPLSLYNMSTLQLFSIESNQFTGSLPPTIGLTLPSLQLLYLSYNHLSGIIPESISNASQLKMFDIYVNNFVGQVPTNLGNFPDLWAVSMSFNNLGNSSENSLDFISSLTNCSALKILSLSGNSFGGALPESVANLSTKLSVLYFGGNEISGNIPASLENLVSLTALALEGNLFTGVIPASLGKLKNLQRLVLYSNYLSGKIPSTIGNLTDIFHLDLSMNELEGTIPLSIANLKRLQLIDVSDNRLSGSIPKEIFGPSLSLLKLKCSRNKFSGILPMEVGKLKSAIEIDLSENNLTAEIPEAIGDCESVEFFDLHGNSFGGTLPLAIAFLRGLKYLDLSQNNLKGEIPKDLEKLRFMLYLNLSFNHLEGEVPNKGVFRNTSAISMVGNTMLCGGVPELQLPRCADKEIKQERTHGLRLIIIIVCVSVVFLLFSGFFICYWRRKSRKESSPTVSTIGFLSKVSYSVLYKATNAFSPTMLIGVGSFSSVYKGILDDEDNQIAVKVLNLQKKGAEKSFIAECKALRTIRHRNLAKVLTCCSSTDYNGNDFKALVFEYMSNGSLDKWIHLVTNEKENRPKGLSLIQRVNIAIDVASAIQYLHVECDQPIIHCDLKPSNVLLDIEMIAHVSDFGLARLISNNSGLSDGQTSTTGMKGTIGYVAPEYATGSEPSMQGDTYSFGILLLEMFTGKRPTDEIFKDDFNLHNFVKMALPERLVQVLDSALLPQGEVEQTSMRSEYENAMNQDSNDGHIEIDDELGNVNYVSTKEKVFSVLEIGLSCSQESPNQRMSIGQVITELQRIKNGYESVEIRRQRRTTRNQSYSTGT